MDGSTQLDIFSQPVIDRYHNTTKLTGQILKEKEIRANSQGMKILEFFRANPGRLFTPPEVWEALRLQSSPVTSVRRSITNLTKMGYLTMTDVMRPGMYDNDNHTWRLA